MNEANSSRFQPREFARLAGVTVRALHHYDRMGLLKPRGRTAAGYRFYSESDFTRLQQIVTLKFIGFPLRHIKRLLDGAEISSALRTQRKTLEAKRRELDRAIAAVGEAERALGSRRKPDWKAFTKIIEIIQMQKNTGWAQQYYNDEAQKRIAERGTLWSPELQKKTEGEWASLLSDIEAAASEGTDPASARAAALAERHAKLIEGFTGGDAAIADGLRKLWADRTNWPADFEKQVFEPFAKGGVKSAQGKAPKLLSEKASALLEQALRAAKQKR
jgi:DNA-binding transcriptional MerR regulator